MKQVSNRTITTEKTATLRPELFSLLAPAKIKMNTARVFEIALLVLLYATFLCAISLIVLMNECVVSPATAFYTLLPLAVASLMLFVRVLCIRR